MDPDSIPTADPRAEPPRALAAVGAHADSIESDGKRAGGRRHASEETLRRRSEILARMHAVCKSHGTSQIAELTGTNYETARRYLNEGAMPSPPFLAALCDVLGVSAEWLMCGQGEAYRRGEPNLANATIHDRIEAVRSATVELEQRLAKLAEEVQ